MSNVLKTENGKLYKFEYDIRQEIVFDNLYIVLLAIPFNDETIDNVFAISKNGKLVWRIKGRDDKGLKLPYENLSQIGDEFFASDFYGRRVQFNPTNGEIIKIDSVK